MIKALVAVGAEVAVEVGGGVSVGNGVGVLVEDGVGDEVIEGLELGTARLAIEVVDCSVRIGVGSARQETVPYNPNSIKKMIKTPFFNIYHSIFRPQLSFIIAGNPGEMLLFNTTAVTDLFVESDKSRKLRKTVVDQVCW